MDIVSKFSGIRVLVVGDVMLDRYWWGDVTRISPEAPVPVVCLRETTLAPGGAANVATNIAGLGAVPTIIGAVGTDVEAEELCGLLETAGIPADHLARVGSRRTTVKTRLLAHNQQIARVDQESVDELSAEDEARIRQSIDQSVSDSDAIVLSDYAKGLLSMDVLKHVITSAHERNIPVVVDPKGREYSKYRRATLLTPNRREAALACNVDDNGKSVVAIAGERLLSELDLNAVLITEGEDGMTLFQTDKPAVHFPASAREVYDSTGAGDTVIAALAVALGAGLQMRDAANIANISAGLVVERVGTATVDIKELAASFAASSFQAAQ